MATKRTRMSRASRTTRKPMRGRATTRKPARTRTAAGKSRKSARARTAARTPATRRARAPKPSRTRRPAPKRARASRPKLAAVRRAPKPVAPAFPQRGGASSKQLVLFELLRARTALLGAIQGLTAGSAEQPLATGTWNARLVVLHLVARDRARLRELETALRGTRVSWAGVTPEEMDRLNEADLASLKNLDWEEARRLLHTTRHELMDVLESVPDEPAEVWSAEHPFGWMLAALPTHDRHHAEILKRWRAERGV